MDLNMAKTIIGDNTLSDEAVSVLLERAKRLAKNQRYWHPDDNPTEEELDAFYERYQFEIYDIAKEVHSSNERGDLIAFSELGVTRKWGKSGKDSLNSVLAAIQPKTYLI